MKMNMWIRFAMAAIIVTLGTTGAFAQLTSGAQSISLSATVPSIRQLRTWSVSLTTRTRAASTFEMSPEDAQPPASTSAMKELDMVSLFMMSAPNWGRTGSITYFTSKKTWTRGLFPVNGVT